MVVEDFVCALHPAAQALVPWSHQKVFSMENLSRVRAMMFWAEDVERSKGVDRADEDFDRTWTASPGLASLLEGVPYLPSHIESLLRPAGSAAVR